MLGRFHAWSYCDYDLPALPLRLPEKQAGESEVYEVQPAWQAIASMPQSNSVPFGWLIRFYALATRKALPGSLAEIPGCDSGTRNGLSRQESEQQLEMLVFNWNGDPPPGKQEASLRGGRIPAGVISGDYSKPT